ncbi:MBL fold metallo-hydrolase [Nonomuraea sp. ZG12]|uniref:MBL fold metallo-hydrolase n=1 Tax=Nonomuraea sp. ZG12 TaxID=3452207 RepID=UPI003F8A34E5
MAFHTPPACRPTPTTHRRPVTTPGSRLTAPAVPHPPFQRRAFRHRPTPTSRHPADRPNRTHSGHVTRAGGGCRAARSQSSRTSALARGPRQATAAWARVRASGAGSGRREHGGACTSSGAAPGNLPELLATAHIDVADVDLVVLTHVHEDHMGWSVSTDGVPMFPNAHHVVQGTEVARLSETSPMRDYLIVPLQRTGQLREISGEVRLAAARGSRLTAIPTPGHTVGHQSVLVDGPGRHLVITGDVLVHAVQLVSPEVGYALEADQAVAAETRRQLLGDAGRRDATLATAHLTRPFVDARRS